MCKSVNYGLLSIILSKFNRLFLIRDAKFKMNQKKKKIRRIQNFWHHFLQEKLKIKLIFISILKNNSNYNNVKENNCEKNLSFLNYVYLILENRIFSKKRCFAHLYTKKNHTLAWRLTEYVQSFGLLYILKN
jgi:hypothetical protein